MIESRPESLTSVEFYRGLPTLPVGIDQAGFPDLLKFDLFELVGLLPVTASVSNLCPDGIPVQPPKEVIEYYQREGTKFTMVSAVVNCYSFRRHGEVLLGRPYALTLFPASKRGEVDRVDVRAATFLDLENMPMRDCVYVDFNPFTGAWGLFGPFGLLTNWANGLYSDEIGFVIGTYFLADRFDAEDVLLSGSIDAPPEIRKRYRRWRIRHYFGQFPDVRPRRIWGAETPIELFLLQGLSRRGIHPIPQYLIYSNGEAYPSFHDMISEESRASETPLITAADLFLEDKKLAIFCDSRRFHRNRAHDATVVRQLEAFGIQSVRVSGKLILENLDKAVDVVTEKLSQLSD